MQESTVSLLVLVAALIVTIISLPDVPGVHSLSDDSSRTRHGRKYKQLSDEEEFDVPEIRDNFPAKVNRFMSSQINRHLEYSYQYLHMAYFFDRSDVALPGFYKFFKKASERELDNARFLMAYVNKRGGFVGFREIDAPKFTAYDSDKAAVKALRRSIEMESDLNQKLHKVHSIAVTMEDQHSKHILEDRFMEQKVELIKELEDHVQRLSHMPADEFSLGLFIYDKSI